MSKPTMFVCRGPSGYLGVTGKNFSLTGEAELIHASPFLKRAVAEQAASRASQILGIAFRVESRPISELSPKRERGGV
jgi:hypothetical protein